MKKCDLAHISTASEAGNPHQRGVWKLTDELVEFEYRQENGEDDDKNDAAHADDQGRFEDAEQCGDESIHLAFLVDGRAAEHGVEFTARFTARDKVNAQGWKVATRGQRLADRCPFADPRGRVSDCVTHRQIADDLGRDFQRFENGHAAAGQDAKRARKPCRIVAPDEFADHR